MGSGFPRGLLCRPAVPVPCGRPVEGRVTQGPSGTEPQFGLDRADQRHWVSELQVGGGLDPKTVSALLPPAAAFLSGASWVCCSRLRRGRASVGVVLPWHGRRPALHRLDLPGKSLLGRFYLR